MSFEDPDLRLADAGRLPSVGLDRPLSESQLSIWLHEQANPGTAAYNISAVLAISGAVGSPTDLTAAVQAVVGRHSALRTVFFDRDGVPVRQVIPVVIADVDIIDASDWRTEDLDRVIADEAAAPFDLERAPLCRIRLLRRGHDEHLLVMTVHHLIGDLWTMATLGHLIATAFDDVTALRPVTIPTDESTYDEFVSAERSWLESAAAERSLEYWRESFATATPLELPGSRRRPNRSTGLGTLQSVPLPPQVWALVERCAATHATTPRVVILAAFHALIRRLGTVARADVVELKANRGMRQARSLGCFVNPVLRTASFASDTTFERLVQQVRDQLAASRPHERYPFGRLVRESSVGPGVDRFEVAFAWQKTSRVIGRDTVSSLATGHDGGTAKIGGHTVSPYGAPIRPAPYALTLIAAGSEHGAELAFEYQSERFSRQAIERLSQRFEVLLATLVADPTIEVDAPDLSLDIERIAWEDEWRRTEHRAPVPVGLAERFERNARASPSDIAIRFGAEVCTYGELSDRSAQLAAHLLERGARRGTVIGLAVERSIDMVAAALAIWKIGAAYLPIDPSVPAIRAGAMLDAAAADMVVTTTEVWSAMSEVAGSVVDDDRVVDLIADAHLIRATDPSALPQLLSDPHGAAYVMFTSGSTGVPKGVVVEHRNLANFAAAMQHEPGLTRDDVVLATTTLAFDISILELFVPLAVGAEVRLLARSEAIDPVALAAAIAGTTVAQGTPTMWQMLVTSGWAGLGGLKVLSGGEPLTRELATGLAGRCGELWNMYGPTETTVWSAVNRVDPASIDTQVIPVGHAIDRTRLYVLDDRRRLAPDGVVGELWIAGDGVARGYIGRDDLTMDRFVHDPFWSTGERMYRTGDMVARRPDGLLAFLGRMDDQVKVRGHRIELGEIESVLSSHPHVAQAAVAVRSFGDDDQRLVAYVVPTAAHPLISSADIRTHVREVLPDYMVPAIVMTLDALPLTGNDKLDRKSLPDPTVVVSAEQPQRLAMAAIGADAELVARVTQIMREVFGDDSVQPTDDFFEWGGHSLTATRAVARVRARLGRDVSVRDLYDHPVIEAFAARVAIAPSAPTNDPDSAGEAGEASASAVLAPAGTVPLSHSQRRMWFMQALDPTTTAYNLTGAMRLRGVVDVDVFRAAVAVLVVQHPGLRSRVVSSREGVGLAIADDIDVEVPVIDLTSQDGGLERAVAQVRALGRRPFDLERAPLFRFVCFEIAADHHVVGLAVHHLLADQWSLGRLVADLAANYQSLTMGESIDRRPSTSPHEYSAWHARAVPPTEVDRQLEYWRHRLADLEPTELPSDRRRAESTTQRAGTIRVSVPPDVAAVVRSHATSSHASEFMVYLAALQVLISRHTGSTDIAIGAPVANRHWVESEDVVSTLVNTVVLRADLAGLSTLGEVIDNARDIALDAYGHQDVPFERLVDELQPERRGLRSPLFQVFLNVQNAPFVRPVLPGLEVDVVTISREVAQFDVAITVDSQISGTVMVDYAADLFDETRVRGWVDELLTIVRSFARSASFVVPRGGASSNSSASGRAQRVEVETDPDDAPLQGLESRLARIWEQVLHVDRVGRHDDFFELGGHSLLAIRVMNELQLETARRPPLVALFDAPTIASFAALIEGDGWMRPWTSMVEVRREGTTAPLFYVSPFLISALSFRDLSVQLGPSRPFYVFEPQGLEDESPLQTSVEEMAAHYIAEMRTVQPRGPYLIGGHCAGGWVAFEMARQLRASGDEIERLVIVDVEPPGITPPPTRWSRYLASRIRLYVGSGRLLGAVRWQVGLIVGTQRARLRSDPGRKRAGRVRAAHHEAHNRYIGGRYDGDMDFIRSEEWAQLADKAWHDRWAELIDGDLHVLVVPGAHSGLLIGDSPADLAKAIGASVER